MAQIIVRRIEEDVKRGLQDRAARHGVSMEEEVRAILRDAVLAKGDARLGLGSRIAALFWDVEDQDQPIPELPDEPFRPAKFD